MVIKTVLPQASRLAVLPAYRSASTVEKHTLIVPNTSANVTCWSFVTGVCGIRSSELLECALAREQKPLAHVAQFLASMTWEWCEQSKKNPVRQGFRTVFGHI
jgi:hypothetical protein